MSDEHDEIAALEQGADDYLTAPVQPRRLRAHILSRLRGLGGQGGWAELQVARPSNGLLSAGEWIFDAARRTLSNSRREVQFPEVLGALLQELFESFNQVVSRERLRQCMQGHGSHSTVDTVDVYVYRLRRQLKVHAVDGLTVDTARGQGYVLRAVRASARVAQRANLDAHDNNLPEY
jgi:DNA-binding response OmpR family regulator